MTLKINNLNPDTLKTEEERVKKIIDIEGYTYNQRGRKVYVNKKNYDHMRISGNLFLDEDGNQAHFKKVDGKKIAKEADEKSIQFQKDVKTAKKIAKETAIVEEAILIEEAKEKVKAKAKVKK